MIGEDGQPLHPMMSVRTDCRGWSETKLTREAAHGDCFAAATECNASCGQAAAILFATTTETFSSRPRSRRV